jgi:hypothetical protein
MLVMWLKAERAMKGNWFLHVAVAVGVLFLVLGVREIALGVLVGQHFFGVRFRGARGGGRFLS